MVSSWKDENFGPPPPGAWLGGAYFKINLRSESVKGRGSFFKRNLWYLGRGSLWRGHYFQHYGTSIAIMLKTSPDDSKLL